MADDVENVPAAIRGDDQLDSVPVVRAESAAALDALFKTAVEDLDTPTTQKPADKPVEKPIDKLADKPVEKPADKPVDKPAGTPPGPTDKPIVPPEPAKKDVFDAVELPPHTKPKTTESFDKVKALARDEIIAREKQISDLNQKLEQERKEASEKLAAQLKEAEELREWKRSVDVENDPSFKEFDTKQQRNVDHILAKLKEAGFSDSDVAEIKKHNARIVWEDVWAYLEENKEAAAKLRVPVAGLRRYVEHKLTENEALADQKRDALTEAKKNSEKFLQERASKQETEQKQSSETVVKYTQQLLSQFPWASEVKIPDSADVGQRKTLEAQNQFARETQERVKKVIGDASSETRAELIVGTVMAYYYKAQADYAESRVKDFDAKLQAATDELTRIKKASGAFKGASSNAPVRPVNTTKENIFERGEDALDAIKNELVGNQ